MSRLETTTVEDRHFAMIGCGIYHGEIIDYDVSSYAEPMFRVRFGNRIATLKPSEIGSR